MEDARREHEKVVGSSIISTGSSRSPESSRSATHLARLWLDQGKREETNDLLAPTYGWFTEGFDTADLKDAKAVLESMR